MVSKSQNTPRFFVAKHCIEIVEKFYGLLRKALDKVFKQCQVVFHVFRRHGKDDIMLRNSRQCGRPQSRLESQLFQTSGYAVRTTLCVLFLEIPETRCSAPKIFFVYVLWQRKFYLFSIFYFISFLLANHEKRAYGNSNCCLEVLELCC